MKISFPGYGKSETLTNFPVMVVLGENRSGFSYSHCLAGGADLRFTDETRSNELKYEIEQWKTNGSSYIWVQTMELRSDSCIWVYWGNSSVSAPSYTTDGTAWPAEYRGVWHLNDNESDSTTNHNNGALSGATVATGIVAQCRNFDGGNQKIEVANSASLNPSYLTLSMWGYARQMGRSMVHKWVGGGIYTMEIYGNKPTFVIRSSVQTYPQGISDSSLGEWVYYSGTYDGANTRMYVNGRLEETHTDGTGSLLGDTGVMRIGQRSDNTSTFNGMVDEVRVESVPRSSNWVWACWISQVSNDYFCSYTPEAGVVNTAVTNITTSSAQLEGTLYGTGQVSDVWAYWGTSDGGTNPAAWNYWSFVGTYTNNGFTNIQYTASALACGTVYYSRFRALNAIGNGWSGKPACFETDFMHALSTRRMRITFSGYDKPETLSNFPALVIFNEGLTNFFYNQFQPAASDLRFSDETRTNELNYEIEEWNTNGNSYVWVQVRELKTNSWIWAYWGNRQAVNSPSYATNGSVWLAGYEGVWHMRDHNPLDSSLNGRHGLGHNNTDAAGVIGGAQYFGGTGTDYVHTANIKVKQTITMSTWVRPEVGSIVWPRIIMNRFQDSYYLGGNSAYQYLLIISNQFLHSSVPMNTSGAWQLIAGTFDGSQACLYVDGVLAAGPTNCFAPADYTTGFGFAANNDPNGGGNEYFKGRMDEVRISSVARSSNWMWACWLNQGSNSLFNSYGTVGSYYPGAVLTIR